MKVHNLSNPKGAKHTSKRRGCGVGSGHGKTSGRGHKGMKARSGGGVRPGFEGGQMPSYRQMPKLKGFKNKFREVSYAINVSRLAEIDAEVIDLAYLQENKKAPSAAVALRILGNGEISKAVVVKASYISPSAKEKIEKAGGKVELI